MREITTYYAEGSSWPFSTKEAAEKAEKEYLEKREQWKNNTCESKYEKLLIDLKNATYIQEGTIATCSFESLKIKGLVRVCQKFAEENKESLNYY